MVVLGLGRMGAAFALAWAQAGWRVRGWNRTPRDFPGVEHVAEPQDAVGGAGFVVLCLYDGEACLEVWARIERSIDRKALVVNTSTVAPEHAADLATRAARCGLRYLHAPVLGSVPAIPAAQLRILAGGSVEDVESSRPLLKSVAAEVLHLPDAATAAKLKLIANASLAAAVVGLRDVLAAAAGADVSAEQALDILAMGPLGTLVRAKRQRLVGTQHMQPADFTVGALAKDLALLAGTSAVTTHAATQIAQLLEGAADTDDDIASICRVPATPVAQR